MRHGNPTDSVSTVRERSEEQAVYESALAEIEEAILNIEVAIRRAERAESALKAKGAPERMIDAMAVAKQELVATRKRLQQAAYLAAEESGLYASQLAMFDPPEADGGQQPLL